jgi:hypothetical protein
MPDPEDPQPDDQDVAETFDEENITPDGRDIATSDMQRDVFDVTSAPQDARAALTPDDDWDPDSADEAEQEEVVRVEEDLDRARPITRDGADLVENDGETADFESNSLADDDIEALGYDAADREDDSLDAELDEGLEETFPASDPVAVSRREH